MAADDDVYFFVHVMKTGGTSFIRYERIAEDMVWDRELYDLAP